MEKVICSKVPLTSYSESSKLTKLCISSISLQFTNLRLQSENPHRLLVTIDTGSHHLEPPPTSHTAFHVPSHFFLRLLHWSLPRYNRYLWLHNLNFLLKIISGMSNLDLINPVHFFFFRNP